MEMDKKERICKYGEVFTPQNIVDQMCDSLKVMRMMAELNEREKNT